MKLLPGPVLLGPIHRTAVDRGWCGWPQVRWPWWAVWRCGCWAAVLSHAVWTVQQGPGAQRGRSRGLRDGDVACCVMGGVRLRYELPLAALGIRALGRSAAAADAAWLGPWLLIAAPRRRRRRRRRRAAPHARRCCGSEARRPWLIGRRAAAVLVTRLPPRPRPPATRVMKCLTAAALLLAPLSAGTAVVAPPSSLCPEVGLHAVGTAALFACVDEGLGRLTRLGGTTHNKSVAFDVIASSTIDGCAEVPGSIKIHMGLGDSSDEMIMISATRNLTCAPDDTWHPNATTRAHVTDTFFVRSSSPPAVAGGASIPASISWNATFRSQDDTMWTAPLSSSFSVRNVSTPKVWVGGPSLKAAQISAASSPLDPIPFGHCDGARDGVCKYWYGGALTDLHFHQNLVTKHQQRNELVDAPSMALPIAIILGNSTSATPVGLSFVQSAFDHPVSMTLETHSGGTVPPPHPAGCDSKPQSCPSHRGRTWCPNDPAGGQCDRAPSPCPPCPPPPPAPPHSHCQPPAKPCQHHPDRCCHPPDPEMHTSSATDDGGGGGFRFSRQYHRLGGAAYPVTFSQSLLLHEDCFRPALKWYDASFPEVMRVDPNVDRALVDGHATSINYRGDKISTQAARSPIATG
eukprot:COSAG01_NODE_1112_length_11654_cov_8.254435_1_plen_630_part_10